MPPPLPPPSWAPDDVLGPQAPVAPLLDRPAGLVGDPGPGLLDLSLPSDETLLAAADPNPRQQYSLIRDARPGRIVDTATQFVAAGQSMDISARHSQATLTQLSSSFTNNAGPVYDADTHWAALPPDYRDAGTQLAHVARRLIGVSDTLTGAQTSSAGALNTLTGGLAATRNRWKGEVDAARGPGGLIPNDRIGGLQARRAQLAVQMQDATTATGVQVHDLVEGYENELRSLLTVFADTGHLPPASPMSINEPGIGTIIDRPGPTGPWTEIFPLDDGLHLEGGGFTPLPDLGPRIHINVPAPPAPTMTDQGQLDGPFPGLMPGGVWYDRNSGNKDAEGKALPGSPPSNLSPPGAGRQGAFKQAKRDSGIPVGRPPDRVLPNIDKRDKVQPGRVYEWIVRDANGEERTVTIRDDAGGHIFVDNPVQNRGPHFNTDNKDHYDY